MKKLTRKEEEIMNLFWDYGAMFVRELLEKYEEPRPHFNTLSTMIRILESNGFPVSSLVKEEKISIEELKELISELEKEKEAQ